MVFIKVINQSGRISQTSNLSKVLKYDKNFNKKKKHLVGFSFKVLL